MPYRVTFDELADTGDAAKSHEDLAALLDCLVLDVVYLKPLRDVEEEAPCPTA